MDLDLVVTPGLGDSSYLLASADEAVVVDPQRDAGRLLAKAEARGLAVRAVVETHVHNDYVSGALELHSATGAEIWGPAAAGYDFPHRPIEDADEIAVGDLRLVALATPGHTPEHTAYAVYAPGGDAPVGVFSGGSLIVGSAGRTDLLGADRADELARSQHRSMRRFLELPDETLLLPTHGAGSFCASGPPQDDRTSTIGRERVSNPALLARDETTFVREQLSGLLAFPAYYAHMAPINRAGPRVLGGVPRPEPRSPAEIAAALTGGARLLDARDGAAFAQAHIPGSLNVPLEDSFGSYVGWLVPFGSAIALVAPDAAGRTEATTQLFRIGYDRIVGYLEGGLDAWASAGRPVSGYPVASLDELASAEPDTVLDVRQDAEWEAGHIPGSRHRFVGDLPEHLPELARAGETLVTCASGYRASMAASLLHAAGGDVRLVADGGVPDVVRRRP